MILFSVTRNRVIVHCVLVDRKDVLPKQSGAELEQVQLKLGFYFTLIFCKFGFSKFVLVEMVLDLVL